MASVQAGFLISKSKLPYDPSIARDQLKLLNGLIKVYGTELFCNFFIRILAKKEIQLQVKSRLIPFKFSRIQRDLHDKKGKRNLTLKPRQIGSTTYHILCRLFLPSILNPGTSGLLISQTKGYGAQHFRIMQRGLKNFGLATPVWMMTSNMSLQARTAKQWSDELLSHLLHTQYSARHEILFDFLDSKILVESAENPDAGTGLTVNHLVATEVAYWPGNPEMLLAQAKETVPTDGTVDYESTPNGMGGYFFEEWQRSKNPDAEFQNHFYPWWWQDEYQEEPAADPGTMTDEERKMAKEFDWTMSQLTWRRNKVTSLRIRFQEKYPEDSETCFLTSGDLFMDKDVLRECKIQLMNKKPLESFQDGQLKIYRRRIRGRRYVIGADPAEGALVSTDNPDFNAAVVLDIDSGEMMADYKSRVPQEDFAIDLQAMGEMYNYALVIVERNIGQNVLATLQKQLLYGNIYLHKDWWKEQKKVVLVPGWPTNMRTRPHCLNSLKALVVNASDFIHSERFVDEALTFIYQATQKTKMGGGRKPMAQQGCHDDIVMAAAFASIGRDFVLGLYDPIESPSQKYGETGEEEDQMT